MTIEARPGDARKFCDQIADRAPPCDRAARACFACRLRARPPPRNGPGYAASARTETQETPICRPDPALLAPQSAPDCKFGRAALKTLDPDQWARLKLEYERQCYQHAEKVVRERFRLLQAASRC